MRRSDGVWWGVAVARAPGRRCAPAEMQPALCRVPGRYDARSLGGSSAQILGLFDVSVLARALEMVTLSICARVGRAARSVRVCVCCVVARAR